METLDFIQLEAEPKEDGQRIEVNAVVSGSDVSRVIDEFYNLMARVRHIDSGDIDKIHENLKASIDEDTLQEALRDFVLNRLTTAAVQKLDVDIALSPGVHAEEDPEKGKNFEFSINLIPRPILTLSSIEPVHVTPQKVVVEDADIKEQLNYTARQFAYMVSADHQDIREGDFALVDVDMSCDGKTVKDLSGLRRTIEIERKLLPDPFIDGILGMIPGDTRNFSFSIEGIDGLQEYKTEVYLHEVQAKKIPEIDDDWVAKNLPQFGTLDGFISYIRKDLEEQAALVEKQDLVYQVRSALEKRLQGTIPDEMYHVAKESLLTSTLNKLEQEDLTLDKYLEDHDMTQDVFNMNVFMQASEYLRQNLALDALAKARGLEPTQDEVKHAKATLMPAASNLSDKEWEERGMLSALLERLRREKALAWLMDTAVIDR